MPRWKPEIKCTTLSCMETIGPPEGFNSKEDIKKAPVTLSLSLSLTLLFFGGGGACFYGIFPHPLAVVLSYSKCNKPSM